MTDTKRNFGTTPDPFSYVAVPISLYFNEEKLGIGTAFTYLHKEEEYLVTNWHNVTGRNPNDSKLKPLNKDAALPNKLVIKCPQVLPYGENEIAVGWPEAHLPLYRDRGDAPEIPVWLEHPQHRHKVDVVAIPISRSELEAVSVQPANALALDLQNIRLRASLDVFVIGFPKGMTGGGNFPIWKRGSIASQPVIDVDELPKILIDTAIREGMSGSPVYIQTSGVWLSEERHESGNFVQKLGLARRFLGIYSGRVGDDPFQAQLGIVWKPIVIEEIIESATLGRSSFHI